MTNRTDTFTRADSTTSIDSPSDGGSGYTATGTWGIKSNTGYYVSAGGAYAPCVLEASVASVDVQVTISVFPAIAAGGPLVRYSNSTNFIHANVNTATNWQIQKCVAGSFTQIGSTYVGTISAGDVLKLSVDSSNNLTAYQNGVSRITGNDSAGSANTKHGFDDYRAGANSLQFDDLSITAAAAGGRTTKNTRSAPLGVEIGMDWRSGP